jgi:hypothetical protein
MRLVVMRCSACVQLLAVLQWGEGQEGKGERRTGSKTCDRRTADSQGPLAESSPELSVDILNVRSNRCLPPYSSWHSVDIFRR